MVMAIKQFNSMLLRYQSWLVRAADPQASVAELAAEARSIFLGVTKAYYFDGVTFSRECNRVQRAALG